MIKYLVILLAMTFLGAIGSIYLKKASSGDGIMEIIKNPSLYIGGFLYFASTVLNIWILKYLDYSVALPLTSLTYIWTMMLSAKMLREKITKKKVIGLVLILAGAVCFSF